MRFWSTRNFRNNIDTCIQHRLPLKVIMSWLSLARSNPSIRWAAGGWTFFIAENAILSENRTWLIQQLGDDQYHLCYGTLSTIATASIGYAYYTIRKAAPMDPQLVLWKALKGNKPPLAAVTCGWIFTTLGLVMASQVAPKMQIPVAMVDTNANDNDNENPTVGPSAPSASSSMKLQVRCPFDFTDKKDPNTALHGLERISRHPGLWSLGLVGLGQSILSPAMPQMIWWMGPAAIAWLGGWHTDSRYKRGMGGTLEPGYASQTSNLPFGALISGRQGHGSWQALANELKPLNAAVAVGASTLWVLRRVVR
jgi:hypothetical protein